MSGERGVSEGSRGAWAARRWLLKWAIFIALFVALFSALEGHYSVWQYALILLVAGIPFYLSSMVTAYFVVEWSRILVSAFRSDE